MKRLLIRFIFVLCIPFWTLVADVAVGTLIESVPATASYKIDNTAYLSFSNSIELVKTKHTSEYQLELFKCSPSGNHFVNISHTTYSVDGTAGGTFVSMEPLVLSTGEVVADTAQISAVVSDTFFDNDPIIIVLKDTRFNLSPTAQDTAKVSVSNNDRDTEVLSLYETEVDSGIFVGYINPTTEPNKKNKKDGWIYVYEDAVISVQPILSSLHQRTLKSTIRLSKSVTIKPSLESLSAMESNGEKQMWVSLKSDLHTAALGEMIPFQVEIGNLTEDIIEQASLMIQLPRTLRYVDSSLKMDETSLHFDKSLLEERILKISIDSIDDAVAALQYVASVVAVRHRTEVQAWISKDDKLISNIAKLGIDITKEHLANRGFIFGQIKADHDAPLENIRLYSDDGTYVLTDKDGKYHFEGLGKRVHVVHIDSESIGGGYEVVGEKSKFADLSIAGIKRVDFDIVLPKKQVKGSREETFVKKAAKTAKMPKYGVSDISSVQESAIIWPPERFNPSTPSVKVAIQHPKSSSVVLTVNQKETSPLNFDTSVSSEASKFVISTYRGLDLKVGDNLIEAKITDSSGAIQTLTKNVHFSSQAVWAEVVEKDSRLIADGKNPVVIAVKLYDRQGFPVTEDTRGSVHVEPPYALLSAYENAKVNPLSQNVKENYYVVYGDGVAYVVLAPTTKTGEAILHFNFDNKDTVMRAWVRPKNRDWVVVGFAEGTVGYSKINENLTQHNSDEVYHRENISLFAKGTIRGDTLLTIAYNSAKPREESLLAKVDPNEHFLIYQDNSRQDFDAQSQKKLYVKIERNQFYALFGDYDTGLEVNELSRYRRVLNGVKSEYNGEVLSYNVFASQSHNAFVKDEIAADGTSGIYRLKNQNIITQSEKVVIEIRQRYKEDQIISRVPMTRFTDYSIDYDAGTLYFKAPLFSTDEDGNPRYIVVDYEIDSDGTSHMVYGGRAALKMGDGAYEFGSTMIREDLGDTTKGLYGIDTKVQINNQLRLEAEYATTLHHINGEKISGDAYLVEAFFQGKIFSTTAYFRTQHDAFGLNQENQILRHSQKIGIDGRVNYFQNIAILYSLYSDRDLLQKKETNTVEVLSEVHHKDMKATFGARHSKENQNMSNQLIAGAEKMFLDNKLKVSGRYEYTLDNPTYAYPTRSQLEFRYALFEYSDLLFRSEWSEYTTVKKLHNSVGFTTHAWQGAEIETALTDGFENDAKNLFATLGLTQQLPVGEHVNLFGGIEKRSTINGVEQNSTEDYTAYAGSVTYTKKPWSANLKAEIHNGTKTKKQNLDFGLYKKVSEEVGLSSGIRYHKRDEQEDKRRSIEANIAAVYRPQKTWIILNRLDLIRAQASDINSNRIVNNLLLYYDVDTLLEIGLQFGLKYIQQEIDESTYDSVVDILGIHALMKFGTNYDLGCCLSTLHIAGGERTNQYGVEVGYTLKQDSRFGLGYNFEGFYDEDFSRQNYTAQGVYFNVRMKFDKDNLKSVIDYASF